MTAVTTNWTDASIDGVDKPHSKTPKSGEVFVLRNIVDFTKTNLNAGNADVAQVLNVPAGTIVWYVLVRVITSETTNGTVDLGYGGTAGTVNVWGNALDIDSTNLGKMLVPIVDKPHYFSAADTIDLVAVTDTEDIDMTLGKLELIAFCTDSGSTIDIGG